MFPGLSLCSDEISTRFAILVWPCVTWALFAPFVWPCVNKCVTIFKLFSVLPASESDYFSLRSSQQPDPDHRNSSFPAQEHHSQAPWKPYRNHWCLSQYSCEMHVYRGSHLQRPEYSISDRFSSSNWERSWFQWPRLLNLWKETGKGCLENSPDCNSWSRTEDAVIHRWEGSADFSASSYVL